MKSNYKALPLQSLPLQIQLWVSQCKQCTHASVTTTIARTHPLAWSWTPVLLHNSQWSIDVSQKLQNPMPLLSSGIQIHTNYEPFWQLSVFLSSSLECCLLSTSRLSCVDSSRPKRDSVVRRVHALSHLAFSSSDTKSDTFEVINEWINDNYLVVTLKE